MGGGDVKLAAALALWFSPASTLKFLVLMSIAGGVVTWLAIALHRLRKKPGRPGDSLWRRNRFRRFGHSSPTLS